MKPMIWTKVILGLGFAGLGTAAMAGNLAEPVVDTPVIVPAPAPVYAGGDWTGFYGGLSLGYGDVDTNIAGVDGDGETYGIHAGYNYDFGQFVLGGEVEYSKTNIDLTGGEEIDNVARLKIRGGFDMGPALLYATAGAARADTTLGNDTGEFIGLGVDYRVSEQFTIGGEVLEHRFDDIGGSGIDADATTFSLRGTFNF